MSKERPIFDVEGDRPSTNKQSEYEHMKREKEELSSPIPPQSREELKKQYPDGKVVRGNFVIERGKERVVFDRNGREIEHTTYKKLNPHKPSEFDIQSRLQATYDDEGYIQTVTKMEIGKLGFRKQYIYLQKEAGERELSSIVEQPILRQGLMDPGPAVGEPTITDLSDIELPPHNNIDTV